MLKNSQKTFKNVKEASKNRQKSREKVKKPPKM